MINIRFTAIMCGLYMLLFVILGYITNRDLTLSINHNIDKKEFLKNLGLICIMYILGIVGFMLRASELMDIGLMSDFNIFLGFVMGVLILSTWLRCFKQYFSNNLWTYGLTGIWIGNQILGIVLPILMFIVYSVLAYWTVRKRERDI